MIVFICFVEHCPPVWAALNCKIHYKPWTSSSLTNGWSYELNGMEWKSGS